MPFRHVGPNCSVKVSNTLSALFTYTVPQSYDIEDEIFGSLLFNELKYVRIEFPSDGITSTLRVNVGYITFYASETVHNPNREQGYKWRVETNSSVEVYLYPNSLDREASQFVYIGLEGGGSSINNFSLNLVSGDRRSEYNIIHKLVNYACLQGLVCIHEYIIITMYNAMILQN